MSMSSSELTTIDPAALTNVSGGEGGGLGETLSNAWSGTKSFAGGLTGGFLHGPSAKVDQVERFAGPKTSASKAGFELGAMGNMAAGKIGDGISAAANYFNPSEYK